EAIIETVKSAGCVLSVDVSFSSGPFHMMSARSNPKTEFASSRTRRAPACVSESVLPMPRYWDPWPGNRRMRLVMMEGGGGWRVGRRLVVGGGEGGRRVGLVLGSKGW